MRQTGPPSSGQLASNIAGFVRSLRAAGLPLGPGSALAALAAVRAVGVERREDFREALRSVLLSGPEQQDLFDQAFHVFFRNPRLLERMVSLLLPRLNTPEAPNDHPGARRLGDALFGDRAGPQVRSETEIELDAAYTWSAHENLRHKDFEQMSLAELAAAKNMLRHAQILFEVLPTRRFRPSPRGARIDVRASIRGMLRTGGDQIPLRRKKPRWRLPPLVLICDISGSMSCYSRMFLHFAHAVASARLRVFTFVFATRLTNVSRLIRDRDVDRSLDRVANAVVDWSGGTRMGPCLKEFNYRWSRRVLAQGATVLLMSDGLDRDDPDRLSAEMERLKMSSRRLIWLNPLLRYEDFEPRAQGARCMLPFVDELRAAHNVASLIELGQLLGRDRAKADAARSYGRGLLRQPALR